MRHRIACAAFLLISGCNASYYVSNGLEQAKLLLGRRYIRDILHSDTISDEDKLKLKLILDARQFAKVNSLSPRGSYTTYKSLSSDNLTWVVMGTPRDSFEPYVWNFPIVGKVPYKGFFSEVEARNEAKTIEAQGYESFVRSSDAISTLGWFDDPVLSSILKKEPHQVVDTIFHELFHANVWIPGSVEFNESAANFVGAVTSTDFFESGSAEISQLSLNQRKEFLSKSRKSLSGMYWLSDGVNKLYDALNELYSSKLTTEEKINKRQDIYTKYKDKYFPEVPEELLPKTVNNSAILQVKVYYTKLKDIQLQYVACGRDIKRFTSVLKNISIKVTNDEKISPYDILSTEHCE